MQSILLIVIGAIVPMLLFRFVRIPAIKFIDSEFLLSYLGIFLGFSFSVVTFVMGLIQKAKDHINASKNYTPDEKLLTKSRISNLNEELAETLIFLFTSFIIIAILMLWEAINIPKLFVPITFWYSKQHILASIKLSVFCWSVYSIYDLLIGTFRTNERVERILER